MDVKKFKQEDFPAYFDWFQDPELNQQLGPMEEDDEWLSYVLSEQDGCTYSAFLHTKLIAVIGIVYPNQEDPRYCITNIAVKPSERGKGIGRQVLKKIMTNYQLKKGQYWIARVDAKNPKAKLFFEKNGWTCVSEPPENNDMYLFEYR